MVKTLLDLGGDTEFPTGNGKTGLHTAVVRGAHDIVALLLDWGAAIDAEDEQRKTPLQLAFSKGNPAMMALLMARGGHCAYLMAKAR